MWIRKTTEGRIWASFSDKNLRKLSTKSTESAHGSIVGVTEFQNIFLRGKIIIF